MITYHPKRFVLYRAFVTLLLSLALVQCIFVFAAQRSDRYLDVDSVMRANALFLGGVILTGVWVIECAYFFARKTRLSIDEEGLSFVNAEGPVEARWPEVSKIHLGRWEVFITVPGKVLGMPLLTHDEKREVFMTWYKAGGFSLSRLPKNALK